MLEQEEAEGQATNLPSAARSANLAKSRLVASGATSLPGWRELLDGPSPPLQDEGEEVDEDPGEFKHGWQRHASKALEQFEHAALLHALRGTTPRGPLPGRARLRSCSGPHSGEWLKAMPTSPALHFTNAEMLCALRRRLGLAVGAEGAWCEGRGRALDAHGHHRAACTRTGRNHARHRSLIAAWRQVFHEAGGHVPQRNVERMLRHTHVPVPPGDNRRLDLVVPGLAVERGLPLFCDVTCVSPLTGSGLARSGATMRDGAIVTDAHRTNRATYPEVEQSGLGRLLCLGVETFGRWGEDVLKILPTMAREKCRGLPGRIRQRAQIAQARRWWGLLSVAAQRSVARSLLREEGSDLAEAPLERPPLFADLPCCD